MISLLFSQPHGDRKMNVLRAILTRRSIRKFQDQPVPDNLIEKLLRAAMSAPSTRKRSLPKEMQVREMAVEDK
jgi:nitroreductase